MARPNPNERIPEHVTERIFELGRSQRVTVNQISARLGVSESYVRRMLVKAGIEPVYERNPFRTTRTR